MIEIPIKLFKFGTRTSTSISNMKRLTTANRFHCTMKSTSAYITVILLAMLKVSGFGSLSNFGFTRLSLDLTFLAKFHWKYPASHCLDFHNRNLIKMVVIIRFALGNSTNHKIPSDLRCYLWCQPVSLSQRSKTDSKRIKRTRRRRSVSKIRQKDTCLCRIELWKAKMKLNKVENETQLNVDLGRFLNFF